MAVKVVRHIKYTNAQRQLASAARATAMDRDVLYHGTRYPQLILTTGVLLRAAIGQEKVCLTRSPEVAAYWALIDRDTDEGRGGIFVLNRETLELAYKLRAVPEPFWNGDDLFHDEAEEEIWDDVLDLAKHLIGVVVVGNAPEARLCTRYKKQVEDRIQRLSFYGPNQGLKALRSYQLGIELPEREPPRDGGTNSAEAKTGRAKRRSS